MTTSRPSEVQERIAAVAVPCHFDVGQVIYVEGEPAESIYILEAGWIKATRMTREGCEQANGVCERFMGSLRRECLDQILFHDGRHVQRIIREYIAYYNQDRPHQGVGQQIPDHYDLPKSKPTGGRVRSRAILGGLHHSYSRATYLN